MRRDQTPKCTLKLDHRTKGSSVRPITVIPIDRRSTRLLRNGKTIGGSSLFPGKTIGGSSLFPRKIEQTPSPPVPTTHGRPGLPRESVAMALPLGPTSSFVAADPGSGAEQVLGEDPDTRTEVRAGRHEAEEAG